MSIPEHGSTARPRWSVKRWLGITLASLLGAYLSFAASTAVHGEPVAGGSLNDASVAETILSVVAVAGLAGVLVGVLGMIVALIRS